MGRGNASQHRLWEEIPSRTFPAAGGCQHPGTCRCILPRPPTSASVSTTAFFSVSVIRTPVTGFKATWMNPKGTHLKILNFVTLRKTLFLHKIPCRFQGLEHGYTVWRATIRSPVERILLSSCCLVSEKLRAFPKITQPVSDTASIPALLECSSVFVKTFLECSINLESLFLFVCLLFFF